jgi:Tfp pilus tip-associated adhesin PilY1
MGRYAENTGVGVDQSRAEIERTLQRYGASTFSYGWDGDRGAIAFRMEGRFIRMVISLPAPDAEEFMLTPTGRERSAAAAREAWEQAVRQRWRAMALVIKAKLEAVEAGISSFEEEFLASTVMPNGQTVGESILPGIEEAYKTGKMPKVRGLLE